MTKPSTSLALAALGFAFFMVGTGSLCVVGAFDFVAIDWHISRTATALLVTAFGATLGLCAPLLQILIGHWPRRSQVLIGLSMMTTGSAVMTIAPNYPILLGARVLMGLGAALTSPMVLALGSTLVIPALQGRALATVVTGMSMAYVVGVPASAWLAASYGPRWLFGIIALTTAAAAGWIATSIHDRSCGPRISFRQFLELIQRPATSTGLAVILFTTAGIFVTYTMIVPIMHDVYGAGHGLISTALLIYGAFGVAGNLIVRRVATAFSAERLLATSMTVLIGVFAALLILPISTSILLVALVVWPIMVDIIWPSQQRRMVELEPEFRGVSLALNSSFLFLGLAGGASLGGTVYPLLGYHSLLICSIFLVGAGLAALTYSDRVQKSRRRILDPRRVTGPRLAP
jgi:DHA1 family inner membrane transport protein